ncbi:MAG: copper resistance protein CopC [Actinobacteria bacterium]|nr:copper resistance protein CopC [Actinomycetota bacterium]
MAVAEVGQTLDDGTYVVVWRVTSSDGHPVQGSFTFVVGEATSTVGDAVANATTVTHGLSRLFVVIRASIFLSLAALIGAIVLLWSSAPRRLSSRASIAVRGAWIVLLAATIEAFFAFGPHAAGVKIYNAFDGDLISATLTTTSTRSRHPRWSSVSPSTSSTCWLSARGSVDCASWSSSVDDSAMSRRCR